MLEQLKPKSSSSHSPNTPLKCPTIKSLFSLQLEAFQVAVETLSPSGVQAPGWTRLRIPTAGRKAGSEGQTSRTEPRLNSQLLNPCEANAIWTPHHQRRLVHRKRGRLTLLRAISESSSATESALESPAEGNLPTTNKGEHQTVSLAEGGLIRCVQTLIVTAATDKSHARGLR